MALGETIAASILIGVNFGMTLTMAIGTLRDRGDRGDEGDGGGGPPKDEPGPTPEPPLGGGGLPLPDAVPSEVRLRGPAPERAGPARRPTHAPERRTPVRD